MFNRRLNIRFILSILAVVLVLGVGGKFLHTWQTFRTAGALKKRAEAAVAAGDKWKALDYYDRYLKLRPTEADAHKQFTLLFVELRNDAEGQSQSYKLLERVLRDEPSNLELRRRAAEVAMKLRRDADARYHYEELLKTNPNDPELLEQLAICEESLAKFPEAILRYRASLATDPKRVPTFLKLVALLRKIDRKDDADTVMNQMVEANLDSPIARLARARYLRNIGLLDSAAKDLEVLRSRLAPDQEETILELSELLLARGDKTGARAEYERGRKLFPTDMRFTVGVIQLDFAAGNRDSAIAALKAAANPPPARSGDVWLLADLALAAEERGIAQSLIAKLESLEGSGSALDYLRARLLLLDRQWLRATKLLVDSRAGLGRLPELAYRVEMLLVLCYSELGQHDRQLAAAQSAVSLDPTSLAARQAVADARLMNGNIDEAIQAYSQLAARSLACRFATIRLLIGKARQSRDPNWAAVEQLLSTTPPEGRKVFDYHLAASQVLFSQGKKSEAKKILEAARDELPKEPAIWAALADLAFMDGGAPAATVVLDEAQRVVGDVLQVRLSRLGLIGKDPAVEKQLKALEGNVESWSKADRSRLLLGLGNVYSQRGAAADALRVLNQAVELEPGSVALQSRLFDAMLASGNVEQLASQVELIRKLEGEDGVNWRFADAVHQTILYGQNQNQAAFQLARTRVAEVAAVRKNWSRLIVLDADLDFSAGNQELAIEKYQRAINLGWLNELVAKRLINLLMDRRRFDEAKEVLANVTATAPQLSDRFGQIATGLSLVQGEPLQNTLRLADSTVPEDSTNANDQLWRGLTLLALKQNEKAEVALRKATTLAPTDTRGWILLVKHLVAQKREAEAEQLLTEIRAKVPSASQPICLAQCYAALGNRAAAERLYAELLQDRPTDDLVQRDACEFYLRFGDTQRAEALLRRMIDRKSTAAWARRNLALVLLASNNYQKSTEALALVDENLKEGTARGQDQRFRALILSTRPGGRREAIQVFEASAKQIRLETQEQFFLAQLYEADGNWPKAKDLYLDVVTNRAPNNPKYLTQWIVSLLRMNETPSASQWIAVLEKASPEGAKAEITELKARLACAQQQPGQARQLLTEYAETEFKRTKNPAIYWSTGNVMAQLNLLPDADSLVKKAVDNLEEKRPDILMSYAEFQARYTSGSAAIATIRRAKNRPVPPELLGQTVVAVTRLAELTNDERGQLATLLDNARQQKPDSVDLRISLADFLDAKGQYDEAIQEYERILATTPNSPIALNNMAWLLCVHRGKPDAALPFVEQSIKTAGPKDIYLDTRAMIFFRLGKTEAAINDLNAALSQTPRPDFEFHLALIYEASGDRAEAKKWFSTAMKHGLRVKDVHRLEEASFRKLEALVQP